MNYKEALIKQLKMVKGEVVCIGLEDEKLLKILTTNEQIKDIYMLTSLEAKPKGFFKHQTTKISPIKMRKKFKKKRINCCLINIEHVATKMNSFVGNSIYITNQKLIFFGPKKVYDLDKLVKRYQHYEVKVEAFSFDQYFIYVIDVSQASPQVCKTYLYRLNYMIHDLGEFIANFLVS